MTSYGVSGSTSVSVSSAGSTVTVSEETSSTNQLGLNIINPGAEGSTPQVTSVNTSSDMRADAAAARESRNTIYNFLVNLLDALLGSYCMSKMQTLGHRIKAFVAKFFSSEQRSAGGSNMSGSEQISKEISTHPCITLPPGIERIMHEYLMPDFTSDSITLEEIDKSLGTITVLEEAIGQRSAQDCATYGAILKKKKALEDLMKKYPPLSRRDFGAHSGDDPQYEEYAGIKGLAHRILDFHGEFNKEREDDLRLAIELVPTSLHSEVTTPYGKRGADNLTPLAVAILDDRVPLAVVRLLLEKGSNPKHYFKNFGEWTSILTQIDVYRPNSPHKVKEIRDLLASDPYHTTIKTAIEYQVDRLIDFKNKGMLAQYYEKDFDSQTLAAIKQMDPDFLKGQAQYR